MRTLVIGGSGFIGLTIAEELAEGGEFVLAYDLVPPPAEITAQLRDPEKVVFVTGDARDEDAIATCIRDHEVDAVILTAAVTADAAREKRSPRQIVDVNIGAVAAAMHACGSAQVSRVLSLSSGAVYGALGSREERLLEDADGLAPENLYAITKLSGEMTAARLASLHGLDLTIGRLGTCFGLLERDTGLRDTLSPQWQIRKAAEQGEEVILPAIGHRDWLYSKDAAAGTIALLRSQRRHHQIYNIAAGFTWSLAEWCGLIQGRFPEFRWRRGNPGEGPNINCYATYDRAPLAIERIVADSDFRPSYDMDRAFIDFFE